MDADLFSDYSCAAMFNIELSTLMPHLKCTMNISDRHQWIANENVLIYMYIGVCVCVLYKPAIDPGDCGILPAYRRVDEYCQSFAKLRSCAVTTALSIDAAARDVPLHVGCQTQAI